MIGACLLTALSAAAQSVALSGKVTDANDGQPMIGVTVTVEGTTRGTISGYDGAFSLSAEQGQVLVVAYMGYQEQRIPVTGQRDLNIVMDYDATQLEELVVVGYGTMKKSDLTGAVSSVKGELLQKTPSATLDQALQGRVAGVTVNAGTGQPGAGAQVRIRGIGSVNANVDPLYVVDGMIVSDINFLSPNDIVSTEVLKDASASAIYGSRAANGVILITTKTGEKSERTNVSFDAYVGLQNRWNKLDLISDPNEYVSLMLDFAGAGATERGLFEKSKEEGGGFNAWLTSYRIGGSKYFPVAKTLGTPDGYDYENNITDWQDAVFRPNALIQNYHVSVDGGSEKTRYALSGNYFSQDGTIIGSTYERVTLRLNTSHQIYKWLKVGETLSFSTSKSRWAMNNSSSPGASVLSGALAMAPWDPTHYPEGSLNYLGESVAGNISASSNFKNATNPYSMESTSHPNNNTERWVGSLYLDITPFTGFSFHSDVSFDFRYSRERSFKDAYDYSTYDKSDNNFLSSNMGRRATLNFNNYATYARTLGKHDFSVMFGHTVEEYNSYSISGSGARILNPIPGNWYLSKTTESRTYAGDSASRSRRMSLIGRLHYSFDNRYMLTVNWRGDMNGAFKENLFGNFPSVAVAWRADQEAFLKDVRNISLLKLRVGWGLLGNDGVSRTMFEQTVAAGGPTFVGYAFGPNAMSSHGMDAQAVATGAAVNTWANLGGRWEVSEHYNIGIDGSFFQNRFSVMVDLFQRDTRDLLLTKKGPAYVGNRFDAMANVGMMRNRGIEFTLEHQNSIRTSMGPLFYSVSGNMSFVKNMMVSMNGGEVVWGSYTKTDEGYAVNSFWGYQYQGVFHSQEDIDAHFDIWNSSHGTAEEVAEHNKDRNKMGFKVGDAKYADLDGNGNIDEQADMTVIGNPFPKFTYGLNLTVEWMGFDLQAFFQGVYGNQIYNALRERTESKGTESKLSTVMRNAWTETNTTGSIPNPANTINFYHSNRFIESGSYLRLKNLQLGYSLPMRVTEKMHIKRLRVYAAVNNLFTITNYTGYDPEVGGGVDYGNYPQSRTWMFGANFNF